MFWAANLPAPLSSYIARSSCSLASQTLMPWTKCHFALEFLVALIGKQGVDKRSDELKKEIRKILSKPFPFFLPSSLFLTLRVHSCDPLQRIKPRDVCVSECMCTHTHIRNYCRYIQYLCIYAWVFSGRTTKKCCCWLLGCGTGDRSSLLQALHQIIRNYLSPQ